MKCPKCGLINPESSQICDCGYNFDTKSQESRIEKISKFEKHNSSFIKNLFTGVVNVVIIGIIGYLGLILIMGILWLSLPPLNELSQSIRTIIDKFYQGFVTVWALATLISFFTAFSGFNVMNKFKKSTKP